MRIHSAESSARQRRGLAPLELVMSLPVLLFTMGLMIIFGTAGAWKIRARANSRQAVWRELTERNGGSDAVPHNLIRFGAEMSTGGASPQIIARNPYEDHTLISGPRLVDSDSGLSLPVEENLLDMKQGTRTGHLSITRDYPLMKTLEPEGMTFHREEHLLDGTRFQYFSMGLGSNLGRRVPLIFPVELGSNLGGGDLKAQFDEASYRITSNPLKQDLLPLEGGDPEIYELFSRPSPDFQPQVRIGIEQATIPALRGHILVPSYCEANPEQVRETVVDGKGGVRERIRQVPGRMKSYYLGQYRAKIQQLEDEAEARGEPLSPEAQALITELEKKIEQLQPFNSQVN